MRKDRRIEHLLRNMARPYREVEPWTQDDALVARGVMTEHVRMRRLTVRWVNASSGVFTHEMFKTWMDWIRPPGVKPVHKKRKEHLEIGCRVFQDAEGHWKATWLDKEIWLPNFATESHARYAAYVSACALRVISPWAGEFMARNDALNMFDKGLFSDHVQPNGMALKSYWTRPDRDRSNPKGLCKPSRHDSTVCATKVRSGIHIRVLTNSQLHAICRGEENA